MFDRLLPADFDAYAPAKWKSNVFNRERLEVKQRLLGLGKALQPELQRLVGAQLSLSASAEHPALWNQKQVDAQHLFMYRDEAARKELDAILDRQRSIASLIEDPSPQRTHLFFALSLRHDRLELSCRLHPDARVDRQNLARKCEDHFEQEKLLRLVHELGDAYQVGIGTELLPAPQIDAEQLTSIVQRVGAAVGPALPGAPVQLLELGRRFSREEALGLGSQLEELAGACLSALAPIYRFIAWTRDNDFVSIRETLQKETQDKRRKGLETQDTVRILRGVFAGKVGVVQTIDAKGGLKVRAGALLIRVGVEDVAKI